MTQIAKISDDLIRANKAYRAGQPIMSDADFDALEQSLAAIDPKHPTLKLVRQDDNFGKTRPLPMWGGSTAKAMNEDEVRNLSGRWLKGQDTHVSLKLDGVSIQIVYTDGKFDFATTKGDNVTGTDISRAVRELLPAQLPGNMSLKLRGEIVMAKTNLPRVNADLTRDGHEPFVNTRNSVVAMIRAHDKYAPYIHYLEVLIYDGVL